MKSPLKKHWIIAFVIAGVGALSLGMGFTHYTNNTVSTASDWMKEESDNATLGSLAIPGSHDSGALYSIGDLSGKCQDAAIGEQLNDGIRFLDIRLKAENNNLAVYHGFINESLSFDSVLTSCYAFLKLHPAETVLLSIKEEQKPSLSTKTFDALIQEKIALSPSFWITSRSLPLLGECRGKLVLLSRYNGNTLGVDCYAGWNDPADATEANTFTLPSAAIDVQDHYKLKDADTKWNEALAAISKANAAPERLSLNFFSGYLVGAFPPSYSLSIAKTLNPKIISSLPKGSKGVLICDFVKPALISAILGGN